MNRLLTGTALAVMLGLGPGPRRRHVLVFPAFQRQERRLRGDPA